jgi:hypothetical protein
MTARRFVSVPLAFLASMLVVAPATGQVARAKAPAKTAQAAAPVALDTALTVLPAGFVGSTYDALARYLSLPNPSAGFYAIRLTPEGTCEDHQIKPAYETGKKRLSVMFDGAHSSSTPGIELFCDRKIVGELNVTASSGEKFRAARIVERGNFIVPMESELRWQSHFEMYAEMPAADANALIERMAYYIVVEPALQRAPAALVADSTREAATLERRDDLTRVQTQIYANSIWLYAVDPTTRRVVAKGPLLPGSCP